MSRYTIKERYPEDVVAIFHCSFHPTKGNIIDWSMKASPDLKLDGVEFSTLPSGLHLVDEDVVHFTQHVHHGISVFRRKPTAEAGMRGFRLESLGILVAQSTCPRPWRHRSSLKDLSRRLADRWVQEQSQYHDRDADNEKDWEILKAWFEKRMFRRIGEEGQWVGWEEELGVNREEMNNEDEALTHACFHPALHLPHLLRILGPSSLILYKYVLARKRILIYTNPPVEPACVLARIAADIVGVSGDWSADDNGISKSTADGPSSGRLKDNRPRILGMVGIIDVGKLTEHQDCGWIACTTDAIFLEKPMLYDLIVDMTTTRPARPAFFMSRAVSINSTSNSSGKRPLLVKYRLVPIRFTFSDVRLWGEIDKALRAEQDIDVDDQQLDDGGNLSSSVPPTHSYRWDGWRVYEDVCVACASAWMGLGVGSSVGLGSSLGVTGKSNGTVWGIGPSGALKVKGRDRMRSWGFSDSSSGSGIRLEGEDEALGIRTLGRGIEGRPLSEHIDTRPAIRGSRSARSASSATASSRRRMQSSGTGRGASHDESVESGDIDGELAKQRRHRRRVHTTLALLSIFYRHSEFLCDRLEQVLEGAARKAGSSFESNPAADSTMPALNNSDIPLTLVLTPRDIVAMELGILSELDARFLEWLAERRCRTEGLGRRVVVRRGWRDIIPVLLGFW